MGIASLLAAALKQVPWTSLAMTYGPELMKKLKKVGATESDEDAAHFLSEVERKISELESLVTQQDKVIREQQERLDALATEKEALEARVKTFQIFASLSAIVAVVALLILFSR